MRKENFSYDAFLSYRRVRLDKKWVQEQLDPALRSAGLKVWLDVRNSRPASDLDVDTEMAIQQSRMHICVISPAYIKELRREGRTLAREFRMLMRSNPSVSKPHLIPLLLRGTKVPERIDWLIRIDWTRPVNHSQEWKRLLEVLQAENLDAPPPAAIKLSFQRSFIILACLACIALPVLGAVRLNKWLNSPRDVRPTITDISHTQLPRPTIQMIDGKVAKANMPVGSSGAVTGIVTGKVAPGSNLFVYVQRMGAGYEDVWHCAGPILLDGNSWSAANVKFRLPLNTGEAKAKIQVLLQSKESCGGVFPDSELLQLAKDITGDASSLIVNVPGPEMHIGDAVLDRTQRFVATGTVRNILEDEEGLCVFIEVTRGTLAVFRNCFEARVRQGKWQVNEQVWDELKPGDTYHVEIGLASNGYVGRLRPEGFVALDQKDGRV